MQERWLWAGAHGWPRRPGAPTQSGAWAASGRLQAAEPGLADPGGLGAVTRALEVVEKDRERPGTGVARDATLLALKGARHAGVSGHVRVLPLASASACAQPVHGHRLPRRRQGRLHGGRVLILALLPPSLAGLLCTERHHFPVSLSCALTLTLFQEHFKQTLRCSFLCHVLSSITYHNCRL